MVKVSSWGRLDSRDHELVALADRAHAAAHIARDGRGLAQGNARSYGDVCLNPDGRLWRTTGLDRFIAFDPDSGRLRCEAGVLLRDLQRMSIAHGWLLPVTPGTQMITVGGAIANDVHGKNHHVLGTFGDHVLGLRLARTDGTVIDCGPDREPLWFAATVGGMGLTGVIVEAELQLRRVAGPWLVTDTVPYRDLDEFFHLADSSEAGWEQTVSWVDCLSGIGRGLFFRANLAAIPDRAALASRRVFRVPFVPPVSLVNGVSLRVFNEAYFQAKRLEAGYAIAHFETYTYPLDNLHDWNRMYGPRGFYQYQSVVPRESGREAVQGMLAAIKAAGQGSFLAVLKTFGARRNVGMMSFPRPGVTLALDFPNRGQRTAALFERLDAIVRAAGGRIYAAKDARMPRDLFESGYPRLAEFLQYRDPGISSSMSRRLIGS
ncbi:FAD-binding oxidoreductase [Massilia sp. YIM B02763]|uniref:FAD-binding oxidoreductase n=1 Tax=Massilia sp. YIM B02763 TaxID=3050130 RepID=UPI0025B6A695|nr:FAD-binding oxidoreductase [Massilia sp. YIM B02763]MDN4053442.1 FAD-binding oxidoreductase [Massilia sp. YIM B02763]